MSLKPLSVVGPAFVPPTAEYPGTLELPSLGYLYEDGKIPEGVLPARPLTTDVEKILVSAAGKTTEIFDTYLSFALKMPSGMTVRDLISGDRQYAIFYIRAASLGPVYHFQWTCDQCRRKNEDSVNITEFPVKKLEPGVKEPFELELPLSRDVISYRLFRGHDEADVEKRMEKEKDRAELKKYQLARCITHINGAPVDPNRFADTFAYVGRMLQGDSNELRLAIQDQDPGLDLVTQVRCKHCLAYEDLDVPMTPEFFRPSKRIRR